MWSIRKHIRKILLPVFLLAAFFFGFRYWQVYLSPITILSEPEENPVLSFAEREALADQVFTRMLDAFEASNEDSTALPPEFAGHYVRKDPVPEEDYGKLVICVTKAGAGTEEKYRKACGTDDILIREVSYSRKTLLQAMQVIREVNAERATPLAYSFWVDDAENGVRAIVLKEDRPELAVLQERCPCILVDPDNGVLSPTEIDASGSETEVSLRCQFERYEEDSRAIYAVLTNSGSDAIHYPALPFLEVLREERWYRLPDSILREMEDVASRDCPGGGKDRIVIARDEYNYYLGEGKYRLCQPYQGSDGNVYTAVCAFEVHPKAWNAYIEIEEQSMSRKAAAAQGCVVVGGDEEKNWERIQHFLEEIDVRIPAVLRIVDPDQQSVTDVTGGQSGEFEVTVFRREMFRRTLSTRRMTLEELKESIF